MSNARFLAEMETFFLALADKTRLRLLNLMRDGEICVCFFTEVLGESQPKISRHLAYLRNAGLVEARRDGKWMHYRIARPIDPGAAAVLDTVLAWLDEQDSFRAEREKYTDICCTPELLVQIARTPMPFISPGPESREEPAGTAEPAYASGGRDELEDFLL